MTKYLIILSILLLLVFNAKSQNFESQTTNYFNSIRDNTALLTAFFQQMPKGGDLHHHFTGSVYGENYIAFAIENGFWLNQVTLDVSKSKPSDDKDWIPFAFINEYLKQKLLEKWSVKDYDRSTSTPFDRHFFATFGFFGAVNGRFEDNNLEFYARGLHELKTRAKSEKVTYLETMLAKASIPSLKEDVLRYNMILRNLQQKNDDKALRDTLNYLFGKLMSNDFEKNAEAYTQRLEKLHHLSNVDDNDFMVRFQSYVFRGVEPVDVFAQLITACYAAQKSPLIVGVNIVGPENETIAMQDYNLHIQFFKFCKDKFPQVKYAMHAGELALGMVKPEDLTWHINAAINIGKASRIGHGVDIPYEKDCYALLNKMKNEKIVIEINLTSNEFILGIKDDKHPITLYRQFEVPMVIATDDAGVLRTNLTEQYVLLAKRYKEISYLQIKQLVLNSITYSFIEEEDKKKNLIEKLKKDFNDFEKLFAKK